MKEEYWGYELMINGVAGYIDLITSEENVRDFSDALIEAIDMEKFGECWVNRFATHDEAKAGISFFQMIETSNVSGHFCERNGDFYINIFSCKPFDVKLAEDVTWKYFKPLSMKPKLIYRDSGEFFE